MLFLVPLDLPDLLVRETMQLGRDLRAENDQHLTVFQRASTLTMQACHTADVGVIACSAFPASRKNVVTCAR